MVVTRLGMSERSKFFEDHRPTVDDAIVVKAARANRTVGSLDALPQVDENSHVVSLTVAFALGNGRRETVIFDRYAATVLKLLLDQLESADWRATQTIPRGVRPN